LFAHEGAVGVLEKVRSTIRKYGLVVPGSRVIVAVSGGPDSVALLHALVSLRGDLEIDLHVFHLNHLLRPGQAEEDAHYVEELAGRLGLMVTIWKADVRGLARDEGISLQEAGRRTRYDALEALRKELRADRIATGQNLEDQAETVLMRLLRGAGSRGLSGIPPVRDNLYIRPLIEISRREIEDYCQEKGLHPRRDPSNEKPIYLRNRIRLELLPLLQAKYNPKVIETLAGTAEVLRAEDDLLSELTLRAFERSVREEGVARQSDGHISLSRPGLLSEPPAIARRLVRMAAGRFLPAGRTPTHRQVEEVLALAERGLGSAQIDLAGSVTVWVEYDWITFAPSQEPDEGLPEEISLAVPGITRIEELGIELESALSPNPTALGPDVAVLDPETLPGPLTVRTRRPGDRFTPLGFRASTKLKNFLIHAKVPRRRRNRIPLVCSGEKIVWVVGHRVDADHAARVGSHDVLRDDDRGEMKLLLIITARQI
jgi:tRNA(Ile)-lysidine synthase